MEEIYTNIGVALSSIIGWVVSKKWIFPAILSGWKWLRNEQNEIGLNNINTSKELNNIKEDANNVYENRIEFLLKQLTMLEDQLAKHSEELAELRNKIVELNSKLYQKTITIAQLREMSCCVDDCKFRRLCELENLKDE